jgi:hypothetical protein
MSPIQSDTTLALKALGFLAITLAASNAIAATGDVAFGIRPSYNNVPDLANPGAFDPDVVVYSLPASGFYSGPRQSFFDVFARIDGGGAQTVAGFGSIIIVSGAGEITFALPPPPISGANNVPNSKNPDFAQNTGLDDSLLGQVNVPGQPGGRRSVGVIGLHVAASTDVPVFNGQGLFAMPIEVTAGLAGHIALTFSQDSDESGFVKTNGTNVTNTARFPHQGATVEVRAAVRGDFNGDLLVNALDEPGFNAALFNLNTFQSQYPWLPALYAGDFNEDGAITALDVPAFEQLANIPEPSTVALAVAAGVPLLLMRRRRSIHC